MRRPSHYSNARSPVRIDRVRRLAHQAEHDVLIGAVAFAGGAKRPVQFGPDPRHDSELAVGVQPGYEQQRGTHRSDRMRARWPDADFEQIKNADFHRLFMGAQGIGIAELAYQNALAYARERLQMKSVNRPLSRQHEVADPIVLHPAVQRLLMTQRAYMEGGRMLACWTAMTLDGALHYPDAQQRADMYEQLAIMTPDMKAMLTEQAFQGASDALQVYGGHGFICETALNKPYATSGSR